MSLRRQLTPCTGCGEPVVWYVLPGEGPVPVEPEPVTLPPGPLTPLTYVKGVSSGACYRRHQCIAVYKRRLEAARGD